MSLAAIVHGGRVGVCRSNCVARCCEPVFLWEPACRRTNWRKSFARRACPRLDLGRASTKAVNVPWRSSACGPTTSHKRRAQGALPHVPSHVSVDEEPTVFLLKQVPFGLAFAFLCVFLRTLRTNRFSIYALLRRKPVLGHAYRRDRQRQCLGAPFAQLAGCQAHRFGQRRG